MNKLIIILLTLFLLIGCAETSRRIRILQFTPYGPITIIIEEGKASLNDLVVEESKTEEKDEGVRAND